MSQTTNSTIPGVWAKRIREGDLLGEEPQLATAFASGRAVRAGYGHRLHLELTPHLAELVADYIESVYEAELSIAGGAGDGADHSLIRTGPAVIRNLRS